MSKDLREAMRRAHPIPEQHRRLMRGYRMPAEWEPHLATYLVWPHNRDTWPGKFEVIPPIFARLAAAIAEFEPVRILVNRESETAEVREMVRAAAAGPSMGQVEIVAIPTNDSWIRDHGPIFVNRIGAGGPKQIALDWRFNSWGEKYGSFDLDDAVPRRLAQRYGFEVIEPGIVLEGGSIDSNGTGSVLTTESCLLNPNRNPELSRPEIEDGLKTYLGATNVLWLGQGIAGDDTDGHVDDLARFAARDTIVTVTEHHRQDANYPVLENNLKRLAEMRDQDGRPFRIETLPMPPALFCDNTRLPASYANFYVLNGGVLMPTFECAVDSIAAATLARLFPARRVVGIPSTDLVWGLGAIHCLTQQHPRW